MNSDRFPGIVAARRDGRVLADNGAGAQIPREALDAVARFLEVDNAQKGAPFARKVRTSAMIAEAKDAFADLIGVPHGTIGLGLNATSIAFDIARCLAHTIRPGDRVVVTDADHFANVVPWTWLARFGAEIERIPVDARGELDEGAYAAALAKEPVLVALPWASNATGSVFDVARLAAAAKDAGAIVAVDGVQAGPHLRIDVPEAVDALYFSCYKMYAPHFGAWYAHPEFARRFFTSDDPQIPSAPFYWSMETGNQNHEGLAGWLGTVAYLRSIGDDDVRTAMDRIAAHERAAHALRAACIRRTPRPHHSLRPHVGARPAAGLLVQRPRRNAGRRRPRARCRGDRSERRQLLLAAAAGGARPGDKRHRRTVLVRPLQRHRRRRPLLRGARQHRRRDGVTLLGRESAGVVVGVQEGAAT